MKYCLKPQAKDALANRLIVIGVSMTIVIASLGFVWFLIWGILGYPPSDPTSIDYTLVTIGYFTWAFIVYYAVVYYAGLGIYHWLKNNIIKCEELKQ